MAKNKYIILLILILLLTIIAGCSGKPAQGITDNNKKPKDNSNITNPGEHKLYPDEIMYWLDNMKEFFVASAVEVDNKTFLIVSWGQKPSSGYHVRISDIVDEGATKIVYVDFETPKGASNDVITYPYTVEVIDKTTKSIIFIPQSGDVEYIPVLYGSQPTEPIKNDGGRIKIIDWDYISNKVYITGIASVFEGNVEYAFEDVRGKVLRKGYTTALSAGPDWGSFHFELSNIPKDAAFVAVFATSAESGKRIYEIKLDIMLK